MRGLCVPCEGVVSLQGVKVFYLSSIQADEAKKLVMTLFRNQQIMVQEDMNINSLIIKATSDTLMEIERFLYAIDKGKGELETWLLKGKKEAGATG